MPDFKLGRLNGRFVVSWWVGGKRKRHRLDADSLGNAEREAIDVISRETVKPETATVASIWEAYQLEKAGLPALVTMGYNWRALAPRFGHLRPDQITIEHSRDYTRARLASRGRNGGMIQPGTVWTELGHLRMILKWAHDRGLSKVLPPVERPAKPAPSERYLTREECQRLIHAAGAPHIRLAILLMLSTAARVGAALDLTWSRVDFERGKIVLRREDMQTRKGRATVPMNASLRAALLRAKEAALSDYVVEWAGKQVKSIRTGFDAAVDAAGLSDVTPHVLRHSAAVHLAESGKSMSEIAQFLGHSNEAVTARVYARYSPEHLRDSAEVLDFTTVRQVR